MCDGVYYFDKPISCTISNPDNPDDHLGKDTDSFLSTGSADDDDDNSLFYLQFAENYENYQHLFTAYFNRDQAIELKKELEQYIKWSDDKETE